MTNIPPPLPHQPYIAPSFTGPKLKGLALAGAIVALVALVLAFIPFCGMTAIPVAVIAVGMAIAGLIGARSGAGRDSVLPGCGVLLGLLALGIGIYQFKRVTEAVTEGSKSADSVMTSLVGGTNQEVVAPAGGTVPTGAVVEGSVSAVYAVRQGNLQVRVLSVVADPKVSATSDPEIFPSKTENGALLLTLELTHIGEPASPAIPYRSWRSGAQRNGVMPGPNTSGHLLSGTGRLEYVVVNAIPRLEATNLRPGKSVREVLTFQLPATDAGQLKLELPARNFEGNGYLRFFIPATMIVRR